jgi:hypothetical protein
LGTTLKGALLTGFQGPFALTYLNGWTDWGGAWRTAYYCKDAFNIVRVVGLAKSPAGGSAGPIAQLPVGWRPKGQVQFMSNTFAGGTNSAQAVTVDSSGNIGPNGVTIAAGGNVSLSVISFLAEQ